jgi:hypothetical protein
MKTYPPMFIAKLRFQCAEVRAKRWPTQVSAGFIVDDITDIVGSHDGQSATITYAGHTQVFKVTDLNRRELDAVQKWVTSSGHGNHTTQQ